MLKTLLVSLALVAAALSLAVGGVRGMGDGGLRFGSTGVTTLATDGLTGFGDGGLSLDDDGSAGMGDGGL